MNAKIKEVRVNRRPWSDGIDLLIIETSCSQVGGPFTVKSGVLEMKEVERDGLVIEPTLSIELHEAQKLMDQLWAAGVRPSESQARSDAMQAVERHLEDMRALVFSKPVQTSVLEGRK